MKIEFIDSNYMKVKIDDESQLKKLVTKKVQYVKKRNAKYGQYVEQEVNLYEVISDDEIKLHRGFIYFLISMNHMFIEDLDLIQEGLRSKVNIDVSSMDNLRSDQMRDLTSLLTLDMGLFQVMTGYGKTEVIATLLKYLESSGLRVMVVTSSSKAFDELMKRCEKFDLQLDWRYNIDKNINLVNAKGFFSAVISRDEKVIEHAKATDILIFDEVEKCINPSVIQYMESYLSGRKGTYGFSATTNKVSTERIYPGQPSYLHERNLNLVKYFGVATVYRLPDASMKSIDLKRFTFPRWLEIDSENDTYDTSYLRDKLYLTDGFVGNMKDVINRLDKGIYIPINSKISINYWLERLTEYRILFISADGYVMNGQYYDLTQVKSMMESNEIDLIFSTMSGYNSLDIPNIKSVLLLMSEMSPDNVLQAIGRSREKSMTIAVIEYDKTIPIYKKKREYQLEQVRGYYKNVNFNEEVINVYERR